MHKRNRAVQGEDALPELSWNNSKRRHRVFVSNWLRTGQSDYPKTLRSGHSDKKNRSHTADHCSSTRNELIPHLLTSSIILLFARFITFLFHSSKWNRRFEKNRPVLLLVATLNDGQTISSIITADHKTNEFTILYSVSSRSYWYILLIQMEAPSNRNRTIYASIRLFFFSTIMRNAKRHSHRLILRTKSKWPELDGPGRPSRSKWFGWNRNDGLGGTQKMLREADRR